MSLRYASICCATVAGLGLATFVAPSAQAVEPTLASSTAALSAVPPVSLTHLTGRSGPAAAAMAAPATAPAAPQLQPAELIPISPNPNAKGSKKKFATFQPGECSFPGVKNPSSCDKAQRWAINQVKNPSQGWSYLCLSFVTHAYGRSSGAPTASAMWDGLSNKRKHPGDTNAPAGALMFWGPNHVALSLGNHVLISTDILGSGDAWVVSYATMQSVWNLDYLGWAEPDFS